MSCRGSRGSTHTHTRMLEHTRQHQRPHQLNHCPGQMALSKSLVGPLPFFLSDVGRSVQPKETTDGDLFTLLGVDGLELSQAPSPTLRLRFLVMCLLVGSREYRRRVVCAPPRF